MKILVDNYSNRTAEVTCPKCNSLLEIDKNDVKYNGYSLSGNVLFTEKEALKDDNVFFGLVVNTCTELGANITITIEQMVVKYDV